MKFEGPKLPSPEEVAKTEKERTLSDAELIKDVAEYKFDEKENKTFESTVKQIENTEQELPKERSQENKEKLNKIFEDENLLARYLELEYKLGNPYSKNREENKKELLEIQSQIDKIVIPTSDAIRNLNLNVENKRKIVNLIGEHLTRPYNSYGNLAVWIKAVDITSKLLTNGIDSFSMEENDRLIELDKKGVTEKNLTARENYEEVYLKNKKERVMQIINPKQWSGLDYKPFEGKLLLSLSQKEPYKLEYESFDPRLELRKVRYFNKEELDSIPFEKRKEIQRERLDNYKEQLLKQKKEIAEIQIDLEKEIRSNSDVSFEELMSSLYLKASGAKLTDNQLDVFRDGINMYTKKHQEVEFYRQKYPEDDKLFNACFGHLPKGEIEIIKGPMTLYFRCHNIEDYALIYSGKFDSEKRLDKHDVSSADMSDGLKTSKSNIPELRGTIIVEKSLGRPINDETYIHEEQHVIHQLFDDERVRQDIFMSSMEKSSTKEQEKVLANSLRCKREDFESRAKNEILAYFKDGTDTTQIKQILLKTKENGGLYDYFRQWYIENGEKERDELISNGLSSDFVDEVFANVFIMEYKIDIIHPAVEALQALSDKSLTKEKIINLLINEPLSKWTKAVKRIQDISDKNFARLEIASIEKKIKEYLETSRSPEGNYDLGGAMDKINELKKEGKLTDEESGELASRLGL